MQEILRVEGLSKRFGGLIACNKISFSVQPNEIFGIIGPNGAGKTTLFNVIAGRHRSTSGSVTLEGKDITGFSSDKIGRTGIGRTFQTVHMFREATVRENLRRAEVIARRSDPVAYFFPNKPPAEIDFAAISGVVGLSGCLDTIAGSLPYGLQKMLGVAMALVTSPKLLLMDEPVAGLNPSEKKSAGQMIRTLRDKYGITILLVEHDMPLVMSACDRILVVSQGRSIALARPAEIRANPHVIEAYLGEDFEFA
jgi:branched-chain amino acid transport system ATP-binding protein